MLKKFWQDSGLKGIFPNLVLNKIEEYLHYIMSVDIILEKISGKIFFCYQITTNRGIFKLGADKYSSAVGGIEARHFMNGKRFTISTLTGSWANRGKRKLEDFNVPIMIINCSTDIRYDYKLKLETNQGIYYFTTFGKRGKDDKILIIPDDLRVTSEEISWYDYY